MRSAVARAEVPGLVRAPAVERAVRADAAGMILAGVDVRVRGVADARRCARLLGGAVTEPEL